MLLLPVGAADWRRGDNTESWSPLIHRAPTGGMCPTGHWISQQLYVHRYRRIWIPVKYWSGTIGQGIVWSIRKTCHLNGAAVLMRFPKISFTRYLNWNKSVSAIWVTLWQWFLIRTLLMSPLGVCPSRESRIYGHLFGYSAPGVGIPRRSHFI